MYKRFAQEKIESFLLLMPVVLITGARQSGKTTLVQTIAEEKGYTYFTFDDALSMSNASRDPVGWIASLPKPAIIDEVQRVPEIFLAIKRDVDEHRRPGRYLLTGSANPLLLPRMSDSLAGRMGCVPLYTFSQGELNRKPEAFVSRLFGEKFVSEKMGEFSFDNLCQIILRGGFPAVQIMRDLQSVNLWVGSYLQTMMERDVRDLAHIEGLREFPRLFRLLATRSGMLLNSADLSRSLGMVNVTVNRYLRLLETLYFIYFLTAWYTNRGKRLIKSPKLHISDTSIVSTLLDIDKEGMIKDPLLTGQLLENFVFAELLKQKSWSQQPFELYHFRAGDYEVDFILERPDGSIYGIEVKSSRMIHSNDLRGIRYLQNIAKDRFKGALVLYLGSHLEPLESSIWAVPLQALWT